MRAFDTIIGHPLVGRTVPGDASYVGRIIIPRILDDGRIGTVDVWAGDVTTYISAPADPSRVLGIASHADECAPMVGRYHRVHSVSGVSRKGAGLGAALYMAAALAREFKGGAGVFSVPQRQKRAKVRSNDAEGLWNRLLKPKGGGTPLATRERAEIDGCSPDDFTETEKRSAAWKRWLDSTEEYDNQAFPTSRLIDFLDGSTVRQRGYVVSLAEIAQRGNLDKEHELAVEKLSPLFPSLSKAEQKRVEKAEDEYFQGKPDAIVRWARSKDASLFPTYGRTAPRAPWATFTPPPRDIRARLVDGSAPLSGAGLTLLGLGSLLEARLEASRRA